MHVSDADASSNTVLFLVNTFRRPIVDGVSSDGREFLYMNHVLMSCLSPTTVSMTAHRLRHLDLWPCMKLRSIHWLTVLKLNMLHREESIKSSESFGHSLEI